MLIGNLGADPEVRSTTNGSRVATLSLATSRQWTGQGGEKQEKTEWHRVICWNNKGAQLADLAEKYMKKGDRIYVEGRIEYRGGSAGAGAWVYEPAGAIHDSTSHPEDTLYLANVNGPLEILDADGEAVSVIDGFRFRQMLKAAR